MREFERVSQDMFWAVPLHEGDARNKAIDHNLSVHALITAYIADTAAKDERIAVLEQITQHPLYEHLVKAEARITELEAQVQELIEELIEELKESANSAIESRSKEYAIKRLVQLTEGGK